MLEPTWLSLISEGLALTIDFSSSSSSFSSVKSSESLIA